MTFDFRDRRDFLRLSATLGAGLLVGSCTNSSVSTNEKVEKPAATKNETETKKDADQKEAEVTATEDLMREHGIIRRALLVYTATANKLRSNAASVSPESLQKTAKLLRVFGEEYHEKKLEETYIFPAVKQAGGIAASYTEILIAQHQRGREITDYILAITSNSRFRL